ncbi:hypothetical protein OE88DRAFT_1654621 [Heliocybe sulcata]|uniref:Uncharacterized protein n=1 Tax=Heliocybe sulcata TaxID=5364 RepID=A0A5C3NA39_9AGAM|nr:hypothetical protein OE88DRAFT_1654621 [Heliocybe sulcata]
MNEGKGGREYRPGYAEWCIVLLTDLSADWLDLPRRFVRVDSFEGLNLKPTSNSPECCLVALWIILSFVVFRLDSHVSLELCH